MLLAKLHCVAEKIHVENWLLVHNAGLWSDIQQATVDPGGGAS